MSCNGKCEEETCKQPQSKRVSVIKEDLHTLLQDRLVIGVLPDLAFADINGFTGYKLNNAYEYVVLDAEGEVVLVPLIKRGGLVND